MARKRRLIQNGINPARFARGQIKFYAFLIPLCAVMSLPIVFFFINAFKPMEELFAYPPRFFVNRPTLDNFIRLFSISSSTTIPASRYLFNSVLSTVLVVAASLCMSVSAGYVLSKKRFRLRSALMEVNNLALMFVAIAVMIPRYFIIAYTGLQNNFFANVVPLLAMPVGLFLVKQFIDQIPDTLVEAAVIDGAGDFRILSSVVMPLVKPALATVSILSFQLSWNNAEASALYINNETLKTFAFYMQNLGAGGTSFLQGASGGNSTAGAGVAAAAMLVMFLPNLILFIVLQSQVMNTMTHSGIK
ncbi:MAG: carbohydrate ABC transporter permease [Oscillospiraceae bacterium]|jgi:ABC-type glycerol-3-phosphate transport system permease component|nr:carbohydrate ABC transporter permease [Oscillospiraceae bacterium]